MRIVVIGGGYVAQLVQLAMPKARLLDWRPQPPKDHLGTRVGPQYLWEPIPGVENVQFDVTTLVDAEVPTLERIWAYKRKIGKEYDGGNWGLQFQHRMIGHHALLPVPRIEYGRRVALVALQDRYLELEPHGVVRYDVLISTIPLNALLLLTKPTMQYDAFKSDPIYMEVTSHFLNYKEMVLNYISSAETKIYRETMFGRDVYYESLEPIQTTNKVNRLLPGKIHEHPQKHEILEWLKHFDVYCFGRFASWSPDELAHETWKEISKWKEMFRWA